MKRIPKMKRSVIAISLFAVLLLAGCKSKTKTEPQTAAAPAPVYFKVDPSTAGVVEGKIRFTGKRPARKPIDMSEEPACVEAHHGKAYDESLVVNPNGTLANVFVYIKGGLEGKKFEDPSYTGRHRPAGLLVSSPSAGHSDRSGIERGQLRPCDAQYSSDGRDQSRVEP